MPAEAARTYSDRRSASVIGWLLGWWSGMGIGGGAGEAGGDQLDWRGAGRASLALVELGGERLGGRAAEGLARRTGWPRGTRRRRSPSSRPSGPPLGSTVISMVFTTAPPTRDGEPDRAVGQGLLGDRVAPLAGLERGLLDGVGLEEAVELRGVAPGAAVVVVADPAGGGVDDGGVEPAGQLDEQPGGLAVEERRGAADGLGQAEPAAGGGDRGAGRGPRSGPDDVTQESCSFGRRIVGPRGVTAGRDRFHQRIVAQTLPEL